MGSQRRLEAREIVVRRGPRLVLDGASLRVDAGEVVVIEGASGSGKSTLLRVMATLDGPSAGQVLLDSVPSTDLPPREMRRRVAFVSQRPPMLPGSVSDNLLAGPRLRGESSSAEQVGAWLGEVGLDRDFAERIAGELSGGEQQRVAIARALANAPEVLLLDEPTSALDPAAAMHVVETILALAKKGLGVIVVTHDRTQASALGGRRYECRAGKLHEEGSA
jgi:putative ABC transport system ATP-binding protein